MATSSALYGLPVPDNRDAPDIPQAMTDYTKKLESILSAEFAKTLKDKGVLPSNTDVTTLDIGVYGSSGVWSGSGVTGMPPAKEADTAGQMRVLPFIGGLKVLRWTTMSTKASTPPRTWVRFQTYSGWGDWIEPSPAQDVKSVAGLKGDISPAALASALSQEIKPIVDAAVSQAAIDAASGDIQVLDARYRVEHDGTNNVVFGKDSARLRKYPDVRNNTAVGLRALYSLEKGRYNDFFGLEAGYSLNGAGYPETEGKGSRNAGFGANTQRFNKTGSLNVSMGRNTLQSNEGGTHNTVIGADSAGGIAHMRLSDGQIENQVPQNFWGNSTLGTAALSRTQGNQHVAVGAYTLHHHKAGHGNVGVGFGAMRNIGKTGGYNGKALVDVSKEAKWQNLPFTIADEKCVFTAPLAHGLETGYMLEVQIERFETQFWYVSEVSGQTVTLTVGMPGYTKDSTMTVLNYTTNDVAPTTTNSVAVGFQAGQLMEGGAEATAVMNAVAIGANAPFIGDNAVTLGNSAQTVHVYAPIQVRSDARDKKDVTDISYGLGFIRALRPVSYRLAPRAGDPADDRLHAGFIAQEVEAAAAGTDFEGVTVNGGAFSIAYEELVPALVRAVQELADEVTMLKEAS